MVRIRPLDELLAHATEFQVGDVKISLADGSEGWIISRSGRDYMLSDTGEWVHWTVVTPSNPDDRARIIWTDLDAAFDAAENNDPHNTVATVPELEQWRAKAATR